MDLKQAVAGATIAGCIVAGSAGVADAGHGHFVMREDRNGETHCRYVAQGQTSKEADEPGGHKFHDNVHTGQPGSDERGTDFDKSANEDRCDHVEERNSKSQR